MRRHRGIRVDARVGGVSRTRPNVGAWFGDDIAFRRDSCDTDPRAGSCLDNAVAESFFASFKGEVVYGSVLATETIARRKTLEWLDCYNTVRRRSYCDWLSSISCEKLNTQAALAA